VQGDGGDSEGWTRCYLCYHVIGAEQEVMSKRMNRGKGRMGQEGTRVKEERLETDDVYYTEGARYLY
jgi:hypothetical protein